MFSIDFFLYLKRSEFNDKIQEFQKSYSEIVFKNNNSSRILILAQGVMGLFKKVKIGKAAGPDAVCGRTLQYCDDQLEGVFAPLFHLSADSGLIPKLWKTLKNNSDPKIY